MDKYAEYKEPPKTREELDFRVREINQRGGSMKMGDYAQIAKTDLSAINESMARIKQEVEL